MDRALQQFDDQEGIPAMRRYARRRCAACGASFQPSGSRDIWCSIPCRFWSHVDKSAGPDKCWPWMKGQFPSGYGQFSVDGIPDYAHRVCLKLSGIKIPKGKYATHGCDNPPCCNPHKDHVRPGTPSQNSYEAHARGRRLNVNYATGERHGMRKLRRQRETIRDGV